MSFFGPGGALLMKPALALSQLIIDADKAWPVPMPPTLLVGAQPVLADNNPNAGNYIVLTKFTAALSGNANIFMMKAMAIGNAMFALYADAAGAPGALIASTGVYPMLGGVNYVAFPTTALVAGTPYWLAHNSDTALGAAHLAAGVRRYKVAAFAGFAFPNPAGVGYTADTTYTDIKALFTGFLPLSLGVTNLKNLASLMAKGDLLVFDGTKLARIPSNSIGKNLISDGAGNLSWGYPP